MKTTVLAVLIYCIGSSSLRAQGKPEDFGTGLSTVQYSEQFESCMKKAQINPDERACAGDELQRQDSRLNRNYRSVMKELSPELRIKLRDAQRSWIKRRDQVCEHPSGVEPGDEGSHFANELYTACMTGWTIERANQEEEMLRNIRQSNLTPRKNFPPANR